MIQVDGTAPYAPTKAVLSVIQRHRQVGVPAITVGTLKRMGVTASLAPRTSQALRLLGLTDDDGKPTDEFEALRKAPSDELGNLLSNLIRNVYAPVFDVVDPTTAQLSEIEDAFRSFTPSGQRPRMVALFTGLMAYAGMIEKSEKHRPGPRPKESPNQRQTSARAGKVAASKLAHNPPPPPPPAADGDTYSVTLQSGGIVSVVVDVNLFHLSTSDRAFVIDLVDKLTGYQQGDQSTSSEENSS